MKQLGNLAIVCAGRSDVLLQIYGGYVNVYVGEGPKRAAMTAKWDDDKAISGFVHELNYGIYTQEKSEWRRLCFLHSLYEGDEINT